MVAANIMARTGEVVDVYKYGNSAQYYKTGWSIYAYTGDADRLLIPPNQYLPAMAAQDLGLSTSQFRNLSTSAKNKAIEDVKRKYAPPGGGGSNWGFPAFRDFSITSGYRSVLGPIQRSTNGFQLGHGVSFAQVELLEGVIPEWTNGVPSGMTDKLKRLSSLTAWTVKRVAEYCKMIRRERPQTIEWAIQEFLELKQAPFFYSNSRAIRRLL